MRSERGRASAMLALSDGKPGVEIVARVAESDCTRALLSFTTSTICASDADGGSALGIGCVYCWTIRGQLAPEAETHTSNSASSRPGRAGLLFSPRGSVR